MRYRVGLALLGFLLGLNAAAQETSESGVESSSAQLQEMRRQLEAQQQETQKLKEEAERGDRELQEMSLKLQKDLQKVEKDLKDLSAASVAPAQKVGVVPASYSPEKPLVQSQAARSDTNAPPTWAFLKISDNVNFRFFATLQPTYEAVQDPNSEGYSQNFYLRRARFGVQATLPEGITVLLQTDDPRLGYAGTTGVKNVNSGFELIDAFAQWAFLGKAAALQAGLFLIPGVRQRETYVSRYLSIDAPTWMFQDLGIEQSVLGRDYGVGLNGALLDDRLSYRVGLFSGYRDPATPRESPLAPAAGSRNPPRIAGRIMYDFFDREYFYNKDGVWQGYAYPGTLLGKPYFGTPDGQGKMLAFGFVGDGQGDYKGFGGDAFFDWPIGPGSVTAEVDYMHYNASPTVYTIGGTPTTLPEQQSFFTDEGYYFKALKLQPFIRFENLTYAQPVNRAKEQERMGGGLNYYVLGFNFKMTAYYEKVIPKVQPATAEIKDFNRFVFQWQGSF